jgi:Arabinose-binding domain of AraC transcription regulator, N-term
MKRGESVSVLTVRPVLDELEARALDVEEVLANAQVSPDALASIETRIPHRSMERVWNASAKAAGDRSLGVHVAETLPIGGYDLIDYARRHRRDGRRRRPCP